MPPNECLEFFEAQANAGPELVPNLVGTGKALAWLAQGLTASRHSPGVVQGGEELFRSVKTHHVDPLSNQIKPGAFEDLATRGLSVDRMSHRTLEEAVEAARDRMAEQNVKSGKTQELAGYVVVEAARLIAQTASDTQEIGVFDTALEENISHADVCALVGTKEGKKTLKSMVLDLMNESRLRPMPKLSDAASTGDVGAPPGALLDTEAGNNK